MSSQRKIFAQHIRFGDWGEEFVASFLEKACGWEMKKVDWEKRSGDFIARVGKKELRIEIKTESYSSGKIALETTDDNRIMGAKRAAREAHLMFYYYPALGLLFGDYASNFLEITEHFNRLSKEGKYQRAAVKNADEKIGRTINVPFEDWFEFRRPIFQFSFDACASNLEIFRPHFDTFSPDKIVWGSFEEVWAKEVEHMKEREAERKAREQPPVIKKARSLKLIKSEKEAETKA